MIILLDADGVLYDFQQRYLTTYNATVAGSVQFYVPAVTRTITKDDWNKWNMEDCEWYDGGIGGVVADAIRTPGWCYSIPLYPHAQKAVADLQTYGDVHIVTSPWNGPHWAHERTKAIERDFGLRGDKVIHAKSKRLITGDIFIDDKPQHVVEWRAFHGGYARLWDQPYNRESTEKRIKSWSDLIRLLHALTT